MWNVFTSINFRGSVHLAWYQRSSWFVNACRLKFVRSCVAISYRYHFRCRYNNMSLLLSPVVSIDVASVTIFMLLLEHLSNIENEWEESSGTLGVNRTNLFELKFIRRSLMNVSFDWMNDNKLTSSSPIRLNQQYVNMLLKITHVGSACRKLLLTNSNHTLQLLHCTDNNLLHFAHYLQSTNQHSASNEILGLIVDFD